MNYVQCMLGMCSKACLKMFQSTQWSFSSGWTHGLWITYVLTFQQGGSFKLQSSCFFLQLFLHLQHSNYSFSIHYPSFLLVIHVRALQGSPLNLNIQDLTCEFSGCLYCMLWSFDGVPHGICSVPPWSLQGATQWANHELPNASVNSFHPWMTLTTWEVCPRLNIHLGMVFWASD